MGKKTSPLLVFLVPLSFSFLASVHCGPSNGCMHLQQGMFFVTTLFDIVQTRNASYESCMIIGPGLSSVFTSLLVCVEEKKDLYLDWSGGELLLISAYLPIRQPFKERHVNVWQEIGHLYVAHALDLGDSWLEYGMQAASELWYTALYTRSRLEGYY